MTKWENVKKINNRILQHQGLPHVSSWWWKGSPPKCSSDSIKKLIKKSHWVRHPKKCRIHKKGTRSINFDQIPNEKTKYLQPIPQRQEKLYRPDFGSGSDRSKENGSWTGKSSKISLWNKKVQIHYKLHNQQLKMLDATSATSATQAVTTKNGPSVVSDKTISLWRYRWPMHVLVRHWLHDYNYPSLKIIISNQKKKFNQTG